MPLDMAPKQIRTRASTSRSRNGCQTCKARHVKCDESRPYCAQCTSTGWTCEGYVKPTGTTTSNNFTYPGPGRTAYEIPFKMPGSQKDRQALHYYCVQAAYDVCGFVQSDFWTQSLLLTSHGEPVVRNMLVALSSVKLLYEADKAGSHDLNSQHYESQLSYNKAVRNVRRYIDSTPDPSATVVLQCCLLLFALDSIRGDHDTALMHLQHGLAIIQNPTNRKAISGRTGSAAHADTLNELDVIFRRMDLQATMFDDARVPQFQIVHPAMRTDTGHHANLAEAQSSLDVLMHELFSFLTTNLCYKNLPLQLLPLWLVQQKTSLRMRFQMWESAFNEFCLRKAATKPRDGRDQDSGFNLLTLHYKSSQLFLDCNFPEDNDIFCASPNVRIEEILALAETLLSQLAEGHARRHTFSAETGIVAPLFIIAMKCKDPLLSARAADLLATSGRTEGLYDSRMVVDMIEQFRLSQIQEKTDLDKHNCPIQSTTDPSEYPLEVVAADIIDLPGGLNIRAKALGVKGQFRAG